MIAEIVGGVFVTVTKKLSLALFTPSLTVTVMVAVPIWPGADVTVTVRFAPAPPKTIFAVGMSVVLSEALVRVRLLEGVPASAYFYFAHSYAALNAGNATVAECSHGASFVAALERDNVLAVQFHPEKSAEAGARVLANYVKYATAKARH